MLLRSNRGGESGSPVRGGPIRYDAFISYSHENRPIAVGLQKALHRIGRSPGQLRALRVFRDDTDLSATPDLWGNIRSALEKSRFLIVILSPSAANSEWVDREVSHWLETRDVASVALVMAGGHVAWDPHETRFVPSMSSSLPPSLSQRGVFKAEPCYVDVSADAPWEYRNPRFRDKATSIAASVHGVERAALASDDLREQRRVQRWRRAAISSLVVLAGASSAATVVAVDREGAAIRERNQAVAYALAAQSKEVASLNPALALALAAESAKATETPTREAGAALINARRAFASRTWQPIGEPLDTGEADTISIAYSPDSRVLATAGHDGDIRLWNPKLGSLTGVLSGADHSQVNSLLFSPDGQLLAAAEGDGKVRLWDVKKGIEAGRPLLGRGPMGELAFSPDGSRVAAAGEGRDGRTSALYLWATDTRKRVARVQFDLSVNDVGFASTGWVLAAGTTDSKVAFLDAQTGRIIAIAHHKDTVSNLAFSPSAFLIASASFDGTVILWGDRNIALGRRAARVHYGSEPSAQDMVRALTKNNAVQAVEFSPDGSFLVSGGWTGKIHVWDSVSGRPRCKPMDSGGIIQRLAFDPEGALFASAGVGRIRLWDPHSCRSVGRPLINGAGYSPLVLFSPDGSQLADINAEGRVQIWALNRSHDDGTVLGQVPGGTNGLAVGSDGALLASAGVSSGLLAWDIRSRQTIESGGAKKPANDVAFAPGAAQLAVAGPDGRLEVWDLRSSSRLDNRRTIATGIAGDLWTVAYDPTGRTLAVGGDAGRVRLYRTHDLSPAGESVIAFTDNRRDWDHVPDGTVRIVDGAGHPQGKPPPGVAYGVTRLLFSPDGSRLASADNDGTVCLWEVQGDLRRLACVRVGEYVSITALAFSRDSSELVVGDLKGGIRRFNATTGELASKLDVQSAARVNDLTVSPDGRVLAVARDSGAIELLDPTSGAALARPRRIHAAGALDLAFSPDGTKLASAGGDGVVGLWQVTDGGLIGKLTAGNGSPVDYVTFTPDGLLATATRSGQVRLLDTWLSEPVCPLAQDFVTGEQIKDLAPGGLVPSACSWR